MKYLLVAIGAFLGSLFGGHHQQASTTATLTLQASSSPVVVNYVQYIDSNLGFSFWYPASWHAVEVHVANSAKYPGGIVTKQLNIMNGDRTITVEEFSSPSFSITDSTGVGACPVCNTVKYYFDLKQHMWMVSYPQGTNTISSVSPMPAKVSNNTMGGLHMFPGSQRFGANVIIPLSAQNFVIVSVDGAIATESADAQAFARTIVATDPTVATPVSVTEQEKDIKAEEAAYSNVNTGIRTYVDSQNGFQLQYPSGFVATTSNRGPGDIIKFVLDDSYFPSVKVRGSTMVMGSGNVTVNASRADGYDCPSSSFLKSMPHSGMTLPGTAGTWIVTGEGDAAMQHLYESTYYFMEHDGLCYKVTFEKVSTSVDAFVENPDDYNRLIEEEMQSMAQNVDVGKVVNQLVSSIVFTK